MTYIRKLSWTSSDKAAPVEKNAPSILLISQSFLKNALRSRKNRHSVRIQTGVRHLVTSAIDHQGGTDSDVLARVGKARVAFIILKNIWASKEIATSTKVRIFNTNVKSILLYGSETWRMTKKTLQKIQTFINTHL